MVGYLLAERGTFIRNNHTAYLTMGVLSKYNNQGIASNLFKLLDYWAIENEIERIELTVISDNHRAVNLYTRNGFIKEGVRRMSMKTDGKSKDEFYIAKYYV